VTVPVPSPTAIFFSEPSHISFITPSLGMLSFVLCVNAESSESDGGMVASVAGVYTVIPVLWGLGFKNEKRTRKKLIGVGLSISATLILALSPGISGRAGVFSGDNAAWKVFFCLGAILCWGILDVMSASLTHTQSLQLVIIFSALAQAFTAALASFLFVVRTDNQKAPPLEVLKLVVGNALGVLGWLVFILVGAARAEVSSFVPLISLYVFLPIVFNVCLGKTLSSGQVAGLILAVLGASGIAWEMRQGNPSSSSEPSALSIKTKENLFPDEGVEVARGPVSPHTVAIGPLPPLSPRQRQA